MSDRRAETGDEEVAVATQPSVDRTVYVDGLYNLFVSGGVAKLRFVEYLAQVDGAGNAHWAGHDRLMLTMPAEAALRMARYVIEQAELLEMPS